jgi:hypothetical protein
MSESHIPFVDDLDGFDEVVRRLGVLQASVPIEIRSQHIGAAAAAAALATEAPVARARGLDVTSLLARAAVFLAALVLVVGGLASADALPGAMQTAAASIGSVFGIDLPGGGDSGDSDDDDDLGPLTGIDAEDSDHQDDDEPVGGPSDKLGPPIPDDESNDDDPADTDDDHEGSDDDDESSDDDHEESDEDDESSDHKDDEKEDKKASSDSEESPDED